MLRSLLISQREAILTAARTHLALRGPFLLSLTRRIITPTHTSQRAVRVAAAHAGGLNVTLYTWQH